ncbi:UDP-glucose 4-epimerase GalE, partial [Mycolicibacterium pulveris]
PFQRLQQVLVAVLLDLEVRVAGDAERVMLHDLHAGVSDLAAAHVAAAKRLAAGAPVEAVYNLGSGSGTSVREIMTAIREVTGIEFEPTVGPRRPGDPARIVASKDLAARDLDWQMRHSVEEMVRSAWVARQQAGEAYPG